MLILYTSTNIAYYSNILINLYIMDFVYIVLSIRIRCFIISTNGILFYNYIKLSFILIMFNSFVKLNIY